MDEKTTPLRAQMIDDMRIRGMGDKAQKAHIRAIKDFAGFLGRSPDTATPDDLRAYQLHMTDAGIAPPTFNARIMALRFLFGTTCKREEMQQHMQFRRQPRRLPVVLSVRDVADIIEAAPGARAQVPGRTQHQLRRGAQGFRGRACSRSATSTATGC